MFVRVFIFRIGFIVCSSKFASVGSVPSVSSVPFVPSVSAQFHCVFKQVGGPPFEVSVRFFVFRIVSLCSGRGPFLETGVNS